MRVSPLRFYRLPLAASSWITFAICLALYWITADPGVSYWDCPEYVTVASKLEIGHPPGNPIWTLAMRVATIPFPAESHAYVINLCSGLLMAFSVGLLCRLIFVPLRLFLGKSSLFSKNSPISSDILAGFISAGASLCFGLSDSAWFSAVEAEVYAFSTFLASLSLWIMQKWWWERDRSARQRWLILLAYITGISLGVHQLNLLLVPVFAMIILYRNYPGRIHPAIVFTVFLFTSIFTGLIITLLIPGLFAGAGQLELFGVNNLGLPYHSGIFALILILLLIFFFADTFFKKYQTVVWMTVFMIFGISSFGVILIRANASPPLNEGTPDNIFSLASYFNRDQYPSTPLLYGHTPYSRPMYQERIIDGTPDYSRFALKKEKALFIPVMSGAELRHRSNMLTSEDSSDNRKILEKGKGYLLSDYKFSQKLTPELDIWLPRITSRNVHDREAYEDWAGMTQENMKNLPVTEAYDSLGHPVVKSTLSGFRAPVFSYRPTYYQNLRYFVAYQSYYMYFRYLFWNFIGRQNDYASNGEIDHGNFITGFSAIDKYLVGDTASFPDEIWKKNKGRNRYFGIPFIIGILGILILWSANRQSRRLLSLTGAMFLMTGLAIVVYLNQLPGEPRERDYTFLLSYMAFAMWIGAGLYGISILICRLIKGKPGIAIACLLSICPATLMALENFDDHDRRGRYETEFFATSLLEFEKPAIIFTHGDNTSFPVWYASEVLGKGPDHTPVDITYLSLPDYAVNLKKQGRKGISTIAKTPQIAYGKYLLTRIPSEKDSTVLPLDEALQILYASGEPNPEFPVAFVKIPSSSQDSLTLSLREFSGGSAYLPFKQLMLLDILASEMKTNEGKILYFPDMIDYKFYKPLEKSLHPVLFGKIYAPHLNRDEVTDLTLRSVEREIKRHQELRSKPRYRDPLIEDQIRRYRGEMVITADNLLSEGNVEIPSKISDFIEDFYPYTEILPGTFTLTDSTFYEGREYGRLLDKLYSQTGEVAFLQRRQQLDTLMTSRRNQWLMYYRSLSPAQRRTLSNRSRRLLAE